MPGETKSSEIRPEKENPLAKGSNPGFALGFVLRHPQMHRWVHVGTVPSDVALNWARTVQPTIELESWEPRTGIYVSQVDMLMLYKDEGGIRLLRWRKPD